MTDTATTPAPPDRRWGLAVAALYGIAVVVYLLLARRIPLPLINPDEYTYGHLARSIADGDGMTWRGEDIALRSALYIYAIVPAWLGDSTTDAYRIAKAQGAFLLCLTALPVWIVARRLLTPGLALLCAGMVLAGTWMTTAGSLLTENLALPLATAAFAAIIVAVWAPGGRAGWLALVLSALAAWARMQCVALVAVLFAALILDAIAAPEPARERLRRDRALVVASGVLTIGGLILAAAVPSTLGVYGGVAEFRPSVRDLLAALGHQSVGLVAMAGFVPVLVVLAASTRRDAWRGRPAGSLLAVTWAAAGVFLVQSAWSMTGYGNWHIQRYVEYVLPVLFLTAFVVVQRGLVTRGRLAAATALVAGLLLFAPPIRQVLEERAAWAISLRMDDLIGVSTPVALALATVIAGGLAMLALHLGKRRGLGGAALAALAVGAVSLTVFAVQDQAGWSWQTRLAKVSRVGFPADLQWIDHAGEGPVARLVVLTSSWRWKNTELFNRDVTQVYGMPDVPSVVVRGPMCRWTPDSTGTIHFSGPCDAVPRRFYTDEEQVRVTLYDQRVQASSPVVGRVVSVPGPPRVKSLLFVPCAPPTPAVDYGKRGRIARPFSRCVPAMEAQLWLDEPGQLVLSFRGDEVDHIVQAGGRSFTLAPRKVTTIRIPVAKGTSQTQLQLDWQGLTPRLVGAELVQGAQRTNLL